MKLTKAEIWVAVVQIAVEQLGTEDELVPTIRPTTSMAADLAADSLDLVEVVMSMEEAFGQEIPDEEAEKMANIGDVVSYIYDNQPEDASDKLAAFKSDSKNVNAFKRTVPEFVDEAA